MSSRLVKRPVRGVAGRSSLPENRREPIEPRRSLMQRPRQDVASRRSTRASAICTTRTSRHPHWREIPAWPGRFPRDSTWGFEQGWAQRLAVGGSIAKPRARSADARGTAASARGRALPRREGKNGHDDSHSSTRRRLFFGLASVSVGKPAISRADRDPRRFSWQRTDRRQGAVWRAHPFQIMSSPA